MSDNEHTATGFTQPQRAQPEPAQPEPAQPEPAQPGLAQPASPPPALAPYVIDPPQPGGVGQLPSARAQAPTEPGHTPTAGPSPRGPFPASPDLRQLPPPPGYGTTPAPQVAANKPFANGFGVGFGVALGVGVIWVALVLATLLGAGIMVRAAGVSNFSPAVTTPIWGPANASNAMLALNISGVIEGAGSGTMFSSATYGYEIADQLDALSADDYAGVLLLMDTPGGSIYGSRAIADAVVRYQERTGHKVVAYVQSMSASGGMYSMAPADLIIADHGTLIGSIGVIFGPFSRFRDVTGLTGNIFTSGVVTTGGITQEYLTQGTGKDFGNPFRDMTDQERAVYTHGLEVEYRQFVEHVSKYRQIPAERIVNDLGAFMFDPLTAVEKGLVDEVMGREAAFREAASFNGIDPDDTLVVTPAKPNEWASLFGAEARVPGHNVPLSTTEGVQATSSMCVGAPTILAFAGDFTKVCGA